jgi:hypothetical protein
MGREWGKGKNLSGSPMAIFWNQIQRDKNMTETEGN